MRRGEKLACKIGSENDDTNDFTERARGGEDSLAYHLSNETEDVSRACFSELSLSLPTSKDGDERKVWAPQKMQMQRIGEAMNSAIKL